jgi:hypothetical protein
MQWVYSTAFSFPLQRSWSSLSPSLTHTFTPTHPHIHTHIHTLTLFHSGCLFSICRCVLAMDHHCRMCALCSALCSGCVVFVGSGEKFHSEESTERERRRRERECAIEQKSEGGKSSRERVRERERAKKKSGKRQQKSTTEEHKRLLSRKRLDEPVIVIAFTPKLSLSCLYVYVCVCV